MPRTARALVAGSVQHVITRFVDREFRLAGAAHRAQYLSRLAAALARTDSRLLGYALMSSHVHLAVAIEQRPLSRLVLPLHTGFALWLNRREGRLGPVFAARPTTVQIPAARVGYLLAYLHNNPVRASVVTHAAASRWSSHRAYLGLCAAPPWLSVDEGLALSGFDASPEGRADFDAFVAARAQQKRDPTLSESGAMALQRAVRDALGPAAHIATPGAPGEGQLECVVQTTAAAALRPRWDGDLRLLVRAASEARGMRVSRVCSRERTAEVVTTRRLVVLAAVEHLGRSVTEAAAAVGLSAQGATQLLSRRPEECERLTPQALSIADSLRRIVP